MYFIGGFRSDPTLWDGTAAGFWDGADISLALAKKRESREPALPEDRMLKSADRSTNLVYYGCFLNTPPKRIGG